MTTPAGHNLALKQGQTESFTALYVQDDGVTPVDLTGWTARMQIRREPCADPLVVEVNTTATGYGVILVNGPLGEVVVTLEAAATTLLAAKRYAYDLFVYQPLPGDDAIALLEGSVSVSSQVTR